MHVCVYILYLLVFFSYYSFSVELWVYIIDYCPKAHLNQAQACAIFVHITWLGYHMTPALLVDTEGEQIAV